jgi:signal transduction histidine kinase
MNTDVHRRPPLRRIVGVGLLAFVATAAIVANSLTWIGSTVPGFFVLPNGVVPSISLPGGPNPSGLFRKVVLAVDGKPLTSSDTLYDHVRQHPPRTDIRYTLRADNGTVEDVVWRTQVFSLANYVSLFGACVLNGVAFLGIALALWWSHRRGPTTIALTSASAIAAVFFTTSVDLFEPSWFRLHLISEALAAAALLHLALVFPVNRIGRNPRWTLSILYLPALLFGLVYQETSSNPAVYEQLHPAALIALAISATAVMGTILLGLLRAQSILVHRQSALAGLGILAATAIATVLTTLTKTTDHQVALDTIASVSFVLPLCIAHVTAKQDSFAIDTMLRRAVAHAFLLFALAFLYGLAMSLEWIGAEALTPSAFALTVLAFGMLLVGIEARDRAQALFDRVLFGRNYHVEHALAALSRVLASAHTIDAVDTQTRNVLAQSIRPHHANLFLRHDDDTFCAPGLPAEQKALVLPKWRIARLEYGELQLRQEEEREAPGSTVQSSWSDLDAEILVPICTGGSLRAVLALGAKESSRWYSADDITFLRTAANQIALAVSNATAFKNLEDLNQHLGHLNESLERQINERTAALHASNEEVNKSLEQVRDAYVKLEQSQSNLLRSDRLATLGRLTAGLAHEMNTPLSAVLNSLKLIRDLSQEYRNSIDDAGVLPEDHREIAAELVSHAESATEWAYKAAAFIRSVKSHGRDAGPGTAQRFAVRDVVSDARGLVAHRLRAASCQIDLVEEPSGITLDGDPSRFNQVLVNLLTNAIDAYEDRGANDGRIEIKAWHQNKAVCVQVRDWAGGIPTSILPHIFDELYTTKGPGRGTGLGLWISRNIVEESLGGTLDVITNREGSCFIAEFPQPVSNPEQTEADEEPTVRSRVVRAA